MSTARLFALDGETEDGYIGVLQGAVNAEEKPIKKLILQQILNVCPSIWYYFQHDNGFARYRNVPGAIVILFDSVKKLQRADKGRVASHPCFVPLEKFTSNTTFQQSGWLIDFTKYYGLFVGVKHEDKIVSTMTVLPLDENRHFGNGGSSKFVNPDAIPLVEKKCNVCGCRENISYCKGCMVVSYCGKEHQKFDWKNHKPFCTLVREQVRK